MHGQFRLSSLPAPADRLTQTLIRSSTHILARGSAINTPRSSSSESGCDESSDDILKKTEWIFGYGSLIWRPGFQYACSNLAVLPGWRREFSQASPDHRGTPEAPGRVVTLREDHDAHCEGVAYKILPEDILSVVRYLDERESGGYTRHYVEINLKPAQRVSALTYIALPGNPHACESIPTEELIALIAERQGPSGANRDYVLNLAKALAAHEIYDPAVEALEERLSRI